MSKETQFIEKGTRIWQGVFIKIERADFEVVDSMGDNKTRGGFGTTWVK
jgi:dUTPase